MGRELCPFYVLFAALIIEAQAAAHTCRPTNVQKAQIVRAFEVLLEDYCCWTDHRLGVWFYSTNPKLEGNVVNFAHCVTARRLTPKLLPHSGFSFPRWSDVWAPATGRRVVGHNRTKLSQMKQHSGLSCFTTQPRFIPHTTS